MSFVSKGQKTMRNMAKKGGKGGMGSYGKAGDGDASGAPHNMAPASKDKTSEPVSTDESTTKGYEEKTSKSSYDPASGKRAKSVADLRNAVKLLSEKSDAGEASPTGSEGGQDSKHTSSSKNSTGYMKAGKSKMDMMSMKKPTGESDQMAGEMEDPLDEEQEDNGQAEEGMTPSGKSRKKNSGLKMMKRKMAEMD